MASLPSAQRASRHRFRSRAHWLRPTGGGFGATDWGGLRTAVIALIELVRGVPMLVALYVSSFIVPMMIPGVQVNLFVSVIASGFTAPYGRSRFRLISSAIRP
jgi:hypothetical protein